MERVKYNDTIAKSIAAFLFLVTIFTWKAGTDPVNIPKEFVLVIGSFYIGCFSYLQFRQLSSMKARLLFFALLGFVFQMIMSIIFSEAPFTHQFFGVFGRSLGLLTYFCLAIL